MTVTVAVQTLQMLAIQVCANSQKNRIHTLNDSTIVDWFGGKLDHLIGSGVEQIRWPRGCDGAVQEVLHGDLMQLHLLNIGIQFGQQEAVDGIVGSVENVDAGFFSDLMMVSEAGDQILFEAGQYIFVT